MALTATRFEYRIGLSHVDRGRSGDLVVIVARHPSETHAHLMLRVLARCLLDEEGLEFGPDMSSANAVDLWTKDLTGRITSWIECGDVAAEKLRKAVLHHHGVRAHVVLDDPDRARKLVAEFAEVGWGRGAHAPVLWTIDRALVAALAENQARRQRWTVTIVGDHFYVDVDGSPVDGAVERTLVGESDVRAS